MSDTGWLVLEGLLSTVPVVLVAIDVVGRLLVWSMVLTGG
jgi:hypothetical protein